ncbi:glycosyltransferase family 2 protein [Bacteroides graminisolvens]|uniref:glycosyltransferase family 2 protein n=1 Tax=Bacteroides graminisolvens TaxID=477666 RepID=UPI002409FF3D|nr:glycosyltransferase family 2 protein [Bacteroides graminisolvens]
MKISIIIATWNAGKTLQECLDSIIPQLTKEVELIVIDGNSNDNTMDILNNNRHFISYLISESDYGIYDAWNKGIRVSRGNWLMFIGADDKLLATAITDYLNFISKVESSFDIISSKRLMTDIDGKEIRTVGSIWSWPSCLKGMPISHPGALHNRKLFDDVGLYSLNYKIAADYELLLRKGSVLETAFIDKITIVVSEGGVSDSYKAIKEYYKVLKSCSNVSFLKVLMLWLNMSVRYFVKKGLRVLGVNIHS